MGIVGAGAAADALHAPGYASCPDASLVAVASRTVESATRLAEKFNIPQVHSDIESLLSDPEVDAVSICTPPHTHRELTARAVAADKHVLLEKPVAHTLEDVAAIRKLVDSADVVIELVRNERFMTIHREARDIVLSGRLGPVRSVLFFTSTTGPDDWTGGAAWPKIAEQGGGGVLLDLAVHKLDLISWLTGQEIVDVAGAMMREPAGTEEGDVEWAGALAVLLEEGAAVTVSASWLGPPDAMLTVVAGSTGLLEANGATGVISVTTGDRTDQSSHAAPWSDADNSNLAMIADFVAACRDRRPPDEFALATWDSGTRWVLKGYELARGRPR